MTRPSATDAVITAAARSIVARDPSPAFREGVWRRLDRRPGWRWQFVAAPAAALLAILALSNLPAGRPGLPAVPRASLVALTPAPAAPATGIIEAWDVLVTSPAVVAPIVPASDAETAWEAASVAPLPVLESLAVSVSQPEAMTIALLDVQALGTTPLTVRPLGPLRTPRLP